MTNVLLTLDDQQEDYKSTKREINSKISLLHAEFDVDIEQLNNDHLDGTSLWFTAQEKVHRWANEPSTDTHLWVHGSTGKRGELLC